MSVRRFAEIDANGLVSRVVVAESVEWCEQNLTGVWLETFVDGSERFNFASVGFTYDEALDAFIPPKPSDDATLDESTFTWVVPEVEETDEA